MSADLSNLIQYFHDCYRADNRERVIYNFLDRKIEDKIFFDTTEELVNNAHPKIPIDPSKSADILKKLELFEREKELVYGSFFICGSYIDFKGKSQRLCSPLFYYPADIERSEDYSFLSIRAKDRRLNVPLIQLLGKVSEDSMQADPLYHSLSSDFIRFEDIHIIVKLMEKHYPHVETSHLFLYPENVKINSLKRHITRLQSTSNLGFIIYPTSMAGIISKSSSSRGVLNELTDMTSDQTYSRPLASLFESSLRNDLDTKDKASELPFLLSEAQQSIVSASRQECLSLIVGPPGTGKTFTTAAIALDHLNRGESVLIVSRTDEAVDVISNKIKTIIETDSCVIRGGRKRSYSTKTNRFLKALLSHGNPEAYLSKKLKVKKLLAKSSIHQALEDLSLKCLQHREQLDGLLQDFDSEINNELNWGTHLGVEKKGLLAKMKTLYILMRNRLQTPIWELSAELFELEKSQTKRSKELLKLRYAHQLLEVLKNNWKDISKFRTAIMTTSDTSKLQQFDNIDFKVILKAFPIWLAKISEIKDFVPLKVELFDVAIIDEATQCDIASCLPIFQRAKRVVLAGDLNQLRHVSFLSRSVQALLKNKYHLEKHAAHQLNYRDQSVLDILLNALQSGNQVSTLDEHFRSIPPIIAFSNQHFYSNELKIMTAKPGELEQGVYVRYCEGIRSKNGSNEKEAFQILADIRQLIDYEKELPKELCTSLGILSPFSGQVDFITKKLLAEFDLSEINKHAIRVGTAYGFQGEERDQMYLSFTVDSRSHHSAFNHINKNEIFNVSITRARNKQHVYTSINQGELPQNNLLKQFLNSLSIINNRVKTINHQDIYAEEICDFLKCNNYNAYWMNYQIADIDVDILVKTNTSYIGINLVGYPGKFVGGLSIEQHQILHRAGVKTVPLPYSDWHFQKDTTQKVLLNFLSEHPQNSPSSAKE